MIVSSQPVAGVAIADRRREEDEAEGEHEEIQHRAAPLRIHARRASGLRLPALPLMCINHVLKDACFKLAVMWHFAAYEFETVSTTEI